MDPHRSPLRCHERTDPEEVLEGACVLGSAHVFIPLSVEPGDYSNAFERVRDKKTMSDAPRMIRNSDSPSAHPKPTCGTMVLGGNGAGNGRNHEQHPDRRGPFPSPVVDTRHP